MTEENHRKWDIITKTIITPITLLLTLSWGIYQYNENKESLLEKEQEIKRQALIQKKENVYKETVTVVSSLANGKSDPQLYETGVKRFNELYWGDLASVESREVESLMVQFGKELNHYLNSSQSVDEGSLINMKQLSLKLARRTRVEIDSLYNISTRR